MTEHVERNAKKVSEIKTSAIRKTLGLYIDIILRGWKYTLPSSLAVTIGSILVFYVPPLIVAELIRGDFYSLETAWTFVAWFGLAWMCGELLWRLAIHIMIRYEIGVMRQLYSTALSGLMDKDMGFFVNRFSGSITKNVITYSRNFEKFFNTLSFEVISQLVPALFAAIVLYFISPWLSIALFGLMTIAFFVISPLVKKRVRMVKVREDAHAALSGHISDVVSNIAAVKSYGSERKEQASHERYISDFIKKGKRSWDYQNKRIDMLVSPIYVITNVVGLLIVLSLGVDPQSKSNLFIGFSYFANVTRFMWSFNSVYRQLEEAVAEASLYVEYTMQPTKINDVEDAKSLAVSDGEIRFDQVAFTHSENTDELFSDLNLTISPGQKVGLIGRSGAGKSTIANLILRFMEVDSGKIIIDGQAICEVTQESLHRSVAYVPQDPSLFHRTLAENISYGADDASDEQIVGAAKRANALEFIEKLPNGFDTMVGERGVKLSGGQRQRIAIARAILKDAPILVLDEATSALDSESEELIQASLGELMKGRTSVVIAHRLSTIAKLDRIIVLDGGKIIEDGKHDELLEQNGVYAKLWNRQSGGFIDG